MRIDPPMSVPTPSGLPWKASRAPSPPLLPPGLSRRSAGCVVRPIRWLTVSGFMIVCGSEVFTYRTAPWARRPSTRVELWSAGCESRPT